MTLYDDILHSLHKILIHCTLIDVLLTDHTDVPKEVHKSEAVTNIFCHNQSFSFPNHKKLGYQDFFSNADSSLFSEIIASSHGNIIHDYLFHLIGEVPVTAVQYIDVNFKLWNS